VARNGGSCRQPSEVSRARRNVDETVPERQEPPEGGSGLNSRPNTPKRVEVNRHKNLLHPYLAESYQRRISCLPAVKQVPAIELPNMNGGVIVTHGGSARTAHRLKIVV
jgi:hypothetical protein